MSKIMLGNKYETFIDDEMIIFRIIDSKDENEYIVRDTKNKNKVSISSDKLKDMVNITPDAFLNIMIASKDNSKDVYVCVNKASDLANNIDTPAVVLRQDVYSMSKNAFGGIGNDIYVGECTNSIDNPNTEQLFEFDDIEDTLCVALYVDDTLNEIFDCIKNKINVFDNQLKDIKKLMSGNSMVKGYCETVKELMVDNDFIGHFRRAFRITQLDFPIDLGDNVSDDGVVTLNKKQVKNIEDLLSSYISNIKVIKYDKDIDVSQIVSTTHMMISDSLGAIYLMTYTVDGIYPVDDDIAAAMM